MTHHERPREMLRWAKAAQRIAIGSGRICNLDAGRHASAESTKDAILRAYPGATNAPSGGHSLWDFWRSMKAGDLVILSAGNREAVVRVARPYLFVPPTEQPPAEGYQHQREAEPVGVNADDVWARAGGMAKSQSVYRGLMRCSQEVPERA